MDADDILDSMSLSDDELLDSLADDMLQELAASSDSDSDDVIEEIHTRAPVASNSSNRGIGGGSGGPAPDLGRMMAQMMPMMSQMFGGGAGASAPNALRGPQLAWDEVVRQHAPADEQSEWLETMRRDELRQRAATRAPPSRAYRQTARPLPSGYLETDTLAASLLNEAVRAAQCEHNPTWRRYHDNLVSQLARSGLGAAFARDFKQQLRERVAHDPDFLAAKASGRFANVTKALAV